ncbi:alpha/beta fold hydrolase [Subtercola sp. YIM 133946]|uniref:alpha/beta fold hydrolase n=1 Tax=Subtercola sp. YIM 133946 TaxID=3118909 RepID=UPI002F947BF9
MAIESNTNRWRTLRQIGSSDDGGNALMKKKPVFGLVPGASHGAWSWQRVIGAMDCMGYRAVAMDLPIEDEGSGVLQYSEAVRDALAGIDDELVLVGHSLGGITIPVVANTRPVRKLVFVAGVMPIPSMSLMQQRAAEPDMIFPPTKDTRDRYYNRADEADARWALAQLRPQSQLPYDEVTPLTTWPNIDIVSIVPTDDHTVNPTWARRAARERFGIEAREMRGADHSPFLSRPADLARLIVELSL